MMLSSLPILPPAPSSLLPHLNPTFNDLSGASQQQQHLHHGHHGHPSRRTKGVVNNRSTLAVLSADERNIAQRKMAIAMYGYSWLKPAGCGKTMLGRREEEVEREEVERQLREVEMQERLAMEAEEQERLARLHEQAEGGGAEGEVERDLDDEVPEADDGDVGAEEGEEGDVVDLDDEIPEAEEDMSDDEDGGADAGDSDGIQEPWIYDSRREPDTDEEDNRFNPSIQRRRGLADSDYGELDERNAQALANAMLDEDELGEMEFDVTQQSHEEMMAGGDRDLDDEVPYAEEGWEHTDTELEESEMDISILPPTGAVPPVIQASGRRSSVVPSSAGRQSVGGARTISGNISHLNQHHLHQQQYYRQSLTRTQQMQTPASAESLGLSSDISSAGLQSTGIGDSSFAQQQNGESQNNRRTWLNAAGGARRNLFGIGRGVQTTTGISGRLFTPSPAQMPSGSNAGFGSSPEDEAPRQESSPRRSGRLLGGVRRGARERDSLD